MPSIAFVTASTSSLPPDLISNYQLHLIPFTLQFIDGNYKEGFDLSISDFYRRLTQADAIPSTAPPSVPQLIQLFQQISTETQADEIVAFHISTTMSKIYQHAVQAAERLPNLKITNIDTGNFSIGSGLQVIEAMEAYRAGATTADVKQLIEQLAPRTSLLFVPATVRYLRMSGRVGRFPALAAALMGIQPVIGWANNGMDVVARPRSPEAARAELLNRIASFVGNGKAQSLGIAHTNDLGAALMFHEQVAARFPQVPIYIGDAGPTLAVHCGPNALALAVIRAE